MRSGRDARSAGTTPHAIAVTNPAVTVKASTIGSIATDSRRGKVGGARAINAWMPPRASARPSAVPAPASSRLSASI